MQHPSGNWGGAAENKEAGHHIHHPGQQLLVQQSKH